MSIRINPLMSEITRVLPDFDPLFLAGYCLDGEGSPV
jgi:hypothetical protein